MIWWTTLAIVAAAQHPRPVEVVSTDVLWMEKTGGRNVRKLVGNVHLRQDSADIYCDSAYAFTDRNVVEAYSRVRIVVGRSTQIRANQAVYDGDEKVLELFGDVILSDARARLETPRLVYRRNEGYGYFAEGGRLSDTANVLTSRRGYYFPASSRARFEGKVLLKGKDFDLTTDSLDYHSASETAHFVAPTWVVTRRGVRVYSDDGRFDARRKAFVLYPRPVLWDSVYRLRADTIFYDDSTGQGRAMCDVRAAHADGTLFLAGDTGYVNRKQGLTAVGRDPYAVRIGEDDTLELYADVLVSCRIGEKNFLIADGDARFATRSISGRADSIAYARDDSVFHLVGDPVVWTERYQLSGDTVRMWIRRASPDSLVVFPDAFSIEIGPPPFHNQLKARRMTVKFVDGRLARLDAEGNAQSLYLVTDGPAYVGLNRSVSRSVSIRFRDNRPSVVQFLGKPEATLSPVHAVWGKENALEDFRPRFDERPRRYLSGE
ncbi:MAG: OstA-like protein [Bacteroidia bacterium]|nr:OstA-like protein [Bacteroidia bacterium]